MHCKYWTNKRSPFQGNLRKPQRQGAGSCCEVAEVSALPGLATGSQEPDVYQNVACDSAVEIRGWVNVFKPIL